MGSDPLHSPSRPLPSRAAAPQRIQPQEHYMKFLTHSSATGKPSSHKLWRHVAFVVATYVVVLNAKGLDPLLLLIYLAIIGGSEIAKRAVDYRFGGASGSSVGGALGDKEALSKRDAGGSG